MDKLINGMKPTETRKNDLFHAKGLYWTKEINVWLQRRDDSSSSPSPHERMI